MHLAKILQVDARVSRWEEFELDPGTDSEIGAMLHDRLQPGQFLHVYRKNNFVYHVFLQNAGNRIHRVHIVAAKGRRRGAVQVGIDKTDQAQAHDPALFNQDCHFPGPRSAADDEEVVVAAEVFAHDRDAPIRENPSQQQEHEVDRADQQNIGAADVAEPK